MRASAHTTETERARAIGILVSTPSAYSAGRESSRAMAILSQTAVAHGGASSAAYAAANAPLDWARIAALDDEALAVGLI